MLIDVFKNVGIQDSDKKVITMNSNNMSYHSSTNNINNIDVLNIKNIINKNNDLKICSFNNNIINPAITINNNNNSCNINSILNTNQNTNIFQKTHFHKDVFLNNNYTYDLGLFTIQSTQLRHPGDINDTNLNLYLKNNGNIYSTILSTSPHLYKFVVHHKDTSGRYYVTIENVNYNYNTLVFNIPTLYNIIDISAQGELNYKGAYNVDDLRNAIHGNLVITSEGSIYHKYSQSYINSVADSHWNLSNKSLVLYRLTCIDSVNDIFNIEHYSYGYLMQPGGNTTPNKIDSTNSIQIFWDNSPYSHPDTLSGTNIGSDNISDNLRTKGLYEGRFQKSSDIIDGIIFDNYYKFKISGLRKALSKTFTIKNKLEVGLVDNSIEIPKMIVNGNIKSYNPLLSSSSILSFTGQHRCILTDTYNINMIGLIVDSDNSYINLNNTTKPEINDALPYVKITSKSQSPCVLGVISNYENNNEYRDFINGGFITTYKNMDNNKRVYINSLGEGGIWIINTNGNLNNGDYIHSSNINGYGEKQISNMLHNYTVAKITCDCDFSLNSNNYKCIEFNLLNKTYRKAFVGCTYHCG